ncbi:hypothetical protein MKX01_000144 [Papaver californicum]|nr:hypothetical protein MKX01_000144 [Papaver californicum]
METVEKKGYGEHILVLPYPLQGHINPILHFSKRLASKNVKVTVALTNYIAQTMKIQVGSPLNIQTISDGYDHVGRSGAASAEEYLERFETFGSKTLTDLIERIRNSDDEIPVSCVVYDSFVPWVLNVTKKLNLIGAVFFTQSLAVTSIYYYIYRGLLKVPVPDGEVISIPGLPMFDVKELPSFVFDVESFPHFLRLLVTQFSNIEKADWVLFNTFDELEPEKGLVITWCPQLEVLSHPALGCFVTHCGWNSTMESLSSGVPMIAFAQWSDQPTNAKSVEDLWKVGIRLKVDEDGILRKKELELCIKENANKWKGLAVEAVSEGGRSDKNVDEFLEAMKREK